MATIWVKPRDGGWTALGRDKSAGVRAEKLQLSANDWGSDKASFELRRDPSYAWPDLAAFTPVEVEVEGKTVWTGRISETPARDGADSVISVQAEGWQYHLDDDTYTRLYVHTNLSEWRDGRSFPLATLGSVAGGQVAIGTVSTDNGSITLTFPKGQPLVAFTRVAVVLDLEPLRGSRAVISLSSSNNDANFTTFVFAGDNQDPQTAPSETLGSLVMNAGATATVSGTATTPRRYVSIVLQAQAAVTPANDVWVKVTAAKVFGSASWESGGASILKASDVASDATGQSATPLLSTDSSQITATTFSIPEYYFRNQQTRREALTAANAFHNNLLKVDVLKRVVFQPRPTSPSLFIGQWTGYEFEDTSVGSGQEVYNKAVVEGTGPDGAPVSVASTGTAPILTRQGFTRAKVIPIDASLTSAAASQIGQTFVAANIHQPFKGSLTIVGAGLRSTGGSPVHAAHALTETGQLLRLLDRIDPDTGGIGRDGTIATVTWTEEDDTLKIELDNSRRNFDAYLARLNLVMGQLR